jgi:competence protein ComEA
MHWFGLARLVGAAVSVVVVVVGALWLLRAPSPSAEATLPIASGGGASPAITLPAPSTLPPVVTMPPPAAMIVVHVAGAVERPGVVVLATPARVVDAVVAAGGAAGDGDLDGVNLAAALADGQRVYVPVVGEVDPSAVPSGGGSGSASSGGSAVGGDPDAPAGPIDLNTATAAELDGLPGVGPATAAAIVDDRARNGPFASVDDLDRVPGIGPAKLAALRDLVSV